MFQKTIILILSSLISAHAVASISLTATRVVFDGAHKEANITVRNANNDVLIQSWIDREHSENEDIPFAVTPPIARIYSKGQQLLRILYQGSGMPLDQESVLWLNVQEIPQKSQAENTLQLAVRQRIKIFFRPKGLVGDPIKSPTMLQWKLTEKKGKFYLLVNNPTPFHVSMVDIKLEEKRKVDLSIDSKMISPKSFLEFPINIQTNSSNKSLTYSAINDYGGVNQYKVVLTGGESAVPVQIKSNAN
jgi:P pilus assembly chaperone PapD